MGRPSEVLGVGLYLMFSLPQFGWVLATAEEELSGGIIASVLELGFQGGVGIFQSPGEACHRNGRFVAAAFDLRLDLCQSRVRHL